MQRPETSPDTRPVEAGHLEIRPARTADLPALQALVERCSDDTLHRRFHGAVGPAMRTELARIAGPGPTHRSWVATDGVAIHGTATLAWGRDGAVEAAFLVEDGWFRQGIGRGLFAAVAREARDAGVPEVTAWVQADNERARRFFRALAPQARTAFAGGGELEISVPTSAVSDLPTPPRPLPHPHPDHRLVPVPELESA